MTTQLDLLQNVTAALTQILDYQYTEEQKNYEAEPTQDHIFHALNTIAEWLHWQPE